jgi:dinuclear metal center YbgI/SA1388 family protein
LITFSQIARQLENLAPLAYQENYDNSGMLLGDPQTPILGVLTCLDVTESVLQEALELKANLIVAHHPIIFSGLKRLSGQNQTERVVMRSIKEGICLYALHTPLDKVLGGTNAFLAQKLELSSLKILAPEKGRLKKLTVFVPQTHSSELLEALAQAGAGNIGNYSHCSFVVQGQGSFKPNERANPFLGKAGEIERVDESRIEVIFPSHIEPQVLKALKEAHPYEEVAYFVYDLANSHSQVGLGMLGELPEAMSGERFLEYCAQKLSLKVIRHTALLPEIKTVAVCSGSGTSLLPKALSQKAQAFVSSDFKYHQFFEAENQIIIADIGHYESERFAAEILARWLKDYFDLPIFQTQIGTNPVDYFILNP